MNRFILSKNRGLLIMAKELRIGIIGLMGYGSTYFRIIAGIEGARVTALCDAREDVLQRAAAQHNVSRTYTDYRQLVNDSEVDAVFIATPHFLHYQMTMAAIAAGKHVFCEKPLAMNAREAEEMVQAAKAAGVKLGCHYNRRQSPHVKMLKQAVSQGLLGDVYAMNAKWMARYTAFMFSPDSAWRIDKNKAGGGILIGRGSHMIDAALYILGNPRVVSVKANVANRLCGFSVDDYAMVMLGLEGGSTLTVECSYVAHLADCADKLEYELFGTKAGACAREQDGNRRFVMGSCAFPENKWQSLGDWKEEDFADRYPSSIIADFVDAVMNDREPLVNGRAGADVTAILDAAFRSAENGQREILL